MMRIKKYEQREQSSYILDNGETEAQSVQSKVNGGNQIPRHICILQAISAVQRPWVCTEKHDQERGGWLLATNSSRGAGFGRASILSLLWGGVSWQPLYSNRTSTLCSRYACLDSSG